MFVKPFKVKSSVQLKTSERKKFRHLVEECFSRNPGISEVLPNKANIMVTKLFPHSNDLGMIQVHFVDKVPLFVTLERDNMPIPTVHTLWKIPDLLPRLTMPYIVLDKLLGGANLMLPGIHPESLPDYWETGDVVAVCTSSNGAALAVGIWAVSRNQAVANGMKGKGVIIYQAYQDQLWHFGSKEKLPTQPPPTYQRADAVMAPSDVSGESSLTEPLEDNDAGTDGVEEDAAVDQVTEAFEEVVIDKDKIVLDACYRAIKTSLKKTDIPILISNFNTQHVKPCLAQPVEIKHTKFKKVGVLMKELESQGLVTIKEVKKGVFHITEVNFTHDLLRTVRRLERETEEEEEEEENIAVVQAFTCNAHATKLFSLYGFKKGDVILRKKMRDVITDYIKSNDMTDPDNKSRIILDPLVSTLMKTRDTHASWNQVMQKVEAACGKCYVIALPDKFPITVKGDLPPIKFTVEKRTGNKKVTVISNFQVFGIEPKELAQKMQYVMSSSAAVVPGLKAGSENVLVQGDARKLATKLLLEQYKIPRSFVAAL